MVGCGMGMVPRPCPAAVQGPGAEMPYRYVSHPIVRAGCRICAGMLLFLAAALAAALPGAARAQSPLQQFLAEVPAGELVPGADAYGAPTGSPPLAPALKGGDLVGYVYLTSDVVNTAGYSGKPIHTLVGLDLEATIVGARMVEHHEPIVLIGIPERSEEHTSELQSLMRISYAVFCLKKTNHKTE